MRPLLHPFLVNGRSGDPALYIETLFEKHAVMFDLGDIAALPPRKVLHLEHVFVTHTHIDHFVGFDHLLRLLVGREKTLHLYGPEGFVDHVHHKLQGYRWDLVHRYACDLVFMATEVGQDLSTQTVRFGLKTGFRPEPLTGARVEDGALCSQPTFRVTTALLRHSGPCLAFAIQEPVHVNVWKNRLEERGLPVGPWLKRLKHAVLENAPDDEPIRVGDGPEMPLGALRDLVTISPGQKIAYVTDVADTPGNGAAITSLARDADILFIEAAFAAADAEMALDRAHLTTAAAGTIAREAGVRRVEPFHFSPRYAGEEDRLMREVATAFGQQ